MRVIREKCLGMVYIYIYPGLCKSVSSREKWSRANQIKVGQIHFAIPTAKNLSCAACILHV